VSIWENDQENGKRKAECAGNGYKREGVNLRRE